MVTGSVLSGFVKAGDELELLPEQRPIRIKGVQSQGRRVERALAGQRAALNLAGISVDEIMRGDVLATHGALKPTGFLDARLAVLPSSPVPVKHRQRVRLHIGCAELLARVAVLKGDRIDPGGEGFVQLRLESPTAARRLDRFVIRRYSPMSTIGGGIVLDANPLPHRRKKPGLLEALTRLDSGDLAGLVQADLEKSPFATAAELAVNLARPKDETAGAIEEMLLSGEVFSFDTAKGERLCPASLFQRVLVAARSELGRFHDLKPLRAGMPQGELSSRLKKLSPRGTVPLLIERAIELGLLNAPGAGLLALPEFELRLSGPQKRRLAEMERAIGQGGLTPPSADELAEMLGISVTDTRALLTYLVDVGRLLCLEGRYFFSTEAIAKARRKLMELFGRKETLTVSEIRDALKSTRKYIMPLLGHFDAIGWTRREEEYRRQGPDLAFERDADA